MPFIFAVLLTIVTFSCNTRTNEHTEIPPHDLPQIEDSGKLVVLTLYSSTTYFIYRGEPMGFQYELAEQFARSLGVKLEVKIASTPQQLQHMLLWS